MITIKLTRIVLPDVIVVFVIIIVRADVTVVLVIVIVLTDVTVCCCRYGLPLCSSRPCNVGAQFSSRRYSFYAFGNSHIMLYHDFVRSLPNVAFESVRLVDDVPFSSFQGRLASTSSFHASVLQAVDAVMSMSLYLREVSQAPQHSRSCNESGAIKSELRDILT